jgi:hypothetical protein
MWIMTSFGPLYPSARPAKHIPAGDNRTLQIRARRREFLDHYRENYDPAAGEPLSGKERTGRAMDYPWACYTTPEAFAAAVLKIGNEIVEDQMTKFKPTTQGKRGLVKYPKIASQLHGLYTAMWSRQLDISDGTSSYDPGNWSSWKNSAPHHLNGPVKIRKSGKGKGNVIDKPHPALCRDVPDGNGGTEPGTALHWFPSNWQAAGLANARTCFDCGYVRPEPKKWTPPTWDKDTYKVTHLERELPAGARPVPQNCAGGVHWFPRNWREAGLEQGKCYDCGAHRVASEPADEGEIVTSHLQLLAVRSSSTTDDAVTSHLQLLAVPSSTTTDAGKFLDGLI